MSDTVTDPDTGTVYLVVEELREPPPFWGPPDRPRPTWAEWERHVDELIARDESQSNAET
jgi:hypothetical protein